MFPSVLWVRTTLFTKCYLLSSRQTSLEVHNGTLQNGNVSKPYTLQNGMSYTTVRVKNGTITKRYVSQTVRHRRVHVTNRYILYTVL
jgi:hypothetical protein